MFLWISYAERGENSSEREGRLIVIKINDNRKIVSLWLASDDPNLDALPEDVRDMCDRYRRKKYMIAAFRSGSENIYENTLGLLMHNRKLTAENEVAEAKAAAGQ